MVAIANVELGEQITASKSINQLRYEQEWIVVLDSPLVELAVVVDWSEFSAFLLDEEEGGCIWAL
jgi:hypothetical protein